MSLAKKKKASNSEKIGMLSESTGTWNYLEIMKYFGFSYGKANNVIREIEETKGALKWYKGKTKRRVKIDDVLEMFNTTRERELQFCYAKKSLMEVKHGDCI